MRAHGPPASLKSESTSYRPETSSSSSPSTPKYFYPTSPTSTLISSTANISRPRHTNTRYERHHSVSSNTSNSVITATTATSEPSAWQIQLTESILSRISTPSISTPSIERKSKTLGSSWERRYSDPLDKRYSTPLSMEPIPQLPPPAVARASISRARSTVPKVARAPAISISFDHLESERSFAKWLQKNNYSNLSRSIKYKPSNTSLSTAGHFDTYVDQHFSKISDSVKCIDKMRYSYQESVNQDSMCTVRFTIRYQNRHGEKMAKAKQINDLWVLAGCVNSHRYGGHRMAVRADGGGT
ncbi:hypothetical protein INT43_009010 [Umbelopsis isabellina]|uniref:Uncharacterized protein n=1 Tax=Mortierella isabellina TaxID=91625 RepID=A0A8H7PW64_MORIS|nr:hypothetical protein INT43_009010 [Umbelopsis isabellina]